MRFYQCHLTLSWDLQGTAPAPRAYHTATQVGRRIFIIGGYGGHGQVLCNPVYLEIKKDVCSKQIYLTILKVTVARLVITVAEVRISNIMCTLTAEAVLQRRTRAGPRFECLAWTKPRNGGKS